MATAREPGYRKVIKRALLKYQECLEMVVDTCILVSDVEGEREAMKELTKVGLTLKRLEGETHGIT